MERSGRVAFGRMDEVIYGVPAAEAVLEVVERIDARRVAIMASATLNRETDSVSNLCRTLGSRFATLLPSVPAHSPRATVVEATRVARECGIDLVVTVGGGSITDAAKVMRLCLANEIKDAGAMDVLRPGAAHLADTTVPQVSVPTTLSAGEFSAIAGITNERSNEKEVSHHASMMPSVVVLDPAMTLATPEWLFLSTGIRAVDHSVEGICSVGSHPYGDAQATRAIALLTSGLARVKADPMDLDARLDCQLGSWLSMAPIATGVPMGASHGIGYVLGAAFDVPHGFTSCVLLPAVLSWNQPGNAERQATVAACMGDPNGNPAAMLDRLISDLGLPRTLGAVGISSRDYQQIAESAMDTRWVPFNPRSIGGPDDVLEILEIAK